jgi:predicted amidophosphoribosyltransferase
VTLCVDCKAPIAQARHFCDECLNLGMGAARPDYTIPPTPQTLISRSTKPTPESSTSPRSTEK